MNNRSTNYKMLLQTTTGALQWEHNFDMVTASTSGDSRAIEYAMRHVKQFACVPWFMAMLLFAEDRGAEGGWRSVGKYKLAEPEVTVIQV